MALSSSISTLTCLVRNSLFRVLAVSLSAVVLAGCQMMPSLGGYQNPVVVEAPAKSITTTCENPRPKICTMRYEPVCAVMATGRITTYPSACNACADIAVSGWRPDPCEDL
jgi:hypothetical protein